MKTLPVNSLRTTFRIIEAMSREGVGISELARNLDIPKSTVHDHVVSLRELGCLVEEDEKYRPSLEFLRLGELTKNQIEVYQASKDQLDRLADETRDFVSLVVEENGKAVICHTNVGDESIPVNVYGGIRMHMHTTAAGKAILAFLPPERVERILDQHGLPALTDNTITDKDELFEELDEIRDQKYALDDEERLIGVRSVGVPIIDRQEKVRGSLTIYGPAKLISDELFKEEYPQLLLSSSNITEVSINYE